MRGVIGTVVAMTLAVPCLAQERTAYAAISSGDLAAAEATLDAERAIFPARPELMLNLATVYARSQRPEQARALYQQVLARDEVLLDMADGATVSSHEVARRGMMRIGTQLSAR